MPLHSSRLIALLTILPAIALAQTSPTLTDATVIQTDGWTHRHVAVTLLDDGASLRITRVDGDSVVLPAASVREIRDAYDRDVTQLVLTGAALPPPPPPSETVEEGQPRPEPPVRRRALRPFTVTLGGGAGYGVPSGKFYDGLENGRLYYADLRLASGPRHYFRFCYRVQEAFDGQTEYIDPENGDEIGLAPATAEIRQYLVSFGFLSGATQGNLLRTYGEFGFGWGDHRVDIAEGPLAGTESEGRMLLSAQGGVLLPFGSSPVGLDLSLSVIAKLFGGEEGEGTGFFFAGQAGLVLLFGRDS